MDTETTERSQKPKLVTGRIPKEQLVWLDAFCVGCNSHIETSCTTLSPHGLSEAPYYYFNGSSHYICSSCIKRYLPVRG